MESQVGPGVGRNSEEGGAGRRAGPEIWSWIGARRLKMAAAEAADTQLLLGVGLIGENAGALPSRAAPSSASAPPRPWAPPAC